MARGKASYYARVDMHAALPNLEKFCGSEPPTIGTVKLMCVHYVPCIRCSGVMRLQCSQTHVCGGIRKIEQVNHLPEACWKLTDFS